VGIEQGIDGTFRKGSLKTIINKLHSTGCTAVLSLGCGALGVEGPLAASGMPVVGVEHDALRLKFGAESNVNAEDRKIVRAGRCARACVCAWYMVVHGP